MSASNRSDDSVVTPIHRDRTRKDGGASPKLTERLNEEKLDHILDIVTEMSVTAPQPLPDKPSSKGGSVNITAQNALKYIGIFLSIVIPIIGATSWINSTIDTKVRESRLEMKDEINSAKTEIKTEVSRAQDSINRLDDKVDRKMDKLSDQLSSIQQDIKNPKS